MSICELTNSIRNLASCNFYEIVFVLLWSIIIFLATIILFCRLKFPSILIVYIVIEHSTHRKFSIECNILFNCFLIASIAISVLVNLLSGRVLLCSDDDLFKSLEQPSPYCIISGLCYLILSEIIHKFPPYIDNSVSHHGVTSKLLFFRQLAH